MLIAQALWVKRQSQAGIQGVKLALGWRGRLLLEWRSLAGLAVVALGCVTLSGCGGTVRQGSLPSANSSQNISASPNTVEFGTVDVGNSADQQVVVSNLGSAAVQIFQANFSDPSFSLVEQSNFPLSLAAGTTSSLKVHFNPSAPSDTTGQLNFLTSADSTSSSTPAASVKLHGKGGSRPGVGGVSLKALTCSSSSMIGSGSDICTVILSGVAPNAGTLVNLSSSTLSVSLPASVNVPAGADRTDFTAAVALVSSAQAATLTATAGSVWQTFNLQLNAAIPGLSVSTSRLSFGSVVLNAAVSMSVTLTSSGTAAVTVNAATVAGAGFSVLGGSFPLTLNPSQVVTLAVQFDPTTAGAATGQLSIVSNSSSSPVTVINLSGIGTVTMPGLSVLSCSNSSFTGSGNDACKVTLSGAAPSGGVNVGLASSNLSVSVPASVNVPTGASSTTFTASVGSVSTTQAATLTATVGSSSQSFAVQLNAATSTLSISTSSLSFGNVVLNSTASNAVTLTSTGTVAVTVNSVTVAGTGFAVSGASFPVTLNPGQTVTISVKFAPTTAGAATGQLTVSSNASSSPVAVVNLSGTGTVNIPGLIALSCTSSSMTGSGTNVCTVTLSSAAPIDGVSVALSSSNLSVVVPASVNVAAGGSGASFTATVGWVSTAQTATLSATEGSGSRSFALQLNAASPVLSINATSISFGSVVIYTPTTQSVTLSSIGSAAVTVNSATVTGSGFSLSGSSFPITLNPSQSVTLSVQFDPATTGSATGQLTVTSNSSTSGTLTINLSGTGDSHEVDLSWNPPGTSSDPIAGYHLYRAPSGTAVYQLLNASDDTQTTYADTTVASGQAYDYIVKTFDLSGNESGPSNMSSVTIP